VSNCCAAYHKHTAHTDAMVAPLPRRCFVHVAVLTHALVSFQQQQPKKKLASPRYAAYALSQAVLGVAPFYRFTFAQPERVGTVAAPPLGSVTAWGPPRFKHRCIFMNDEELLGFFRRDPLGEQVRQTFTISPSSPVGCDHHRVCSCNHMNDIL
jgi:hypothetical protein